MWWYYLWATLLLLVNSMAWCGNLLSLPGNWVIVAATALFVWLVPVPVNSTPTLGWKVVLVIVVMAFLGEVLEFAAGAAGAAKHGASRRSIGLSIVGTIVGSVMGVAAGIPIPVIGSAVGAIIGGALGAFVGAYLGESWKGGNSEQSARVAQGAFVGRLWGTTAKLAVGAIMVVLVTFCSFF